MVFVEDDDAGAGPMLVYTPSTIRARRGKDIRRWRRIYTSLMMHIHVPRLGAPRIAHSSALILVIPVASQATALEPFIGPSIPFLMMLMC